MSSSAPSSSRRRAGSGRTGTARTSRCSASTAIGSCRARPSGNRAGGRRSSTPSTSRCATGPGSSTCRRSRSSTSPGPGALAALERLAVNQVDVAPGRTVYTPLLNAAGGILADLTIMRLAHDQFRVVTGGGMGMRDKKIFRDALPADGSAQLHDVTNAFTTFGLWGPRARDVLGAAADGSDDISHKGFPFLTSKTVDIDGVRTLASRISYVGELGWEIYVPIEQGLRVWDAHLGARAAARPRAGRHRHVRGHVAPREGLPRARRRARARLRPRRGRDGATDGQGRRTSSGARPTSAARRGAGRDPVHADRRRPHLDERREALHARPRADPRRGRQPARRREGPPVVRHERRLRAVGRQAPA